MTDIVFSFCENLEFEHFRELAISFSLRPKTVLNAIKSEGDSYGCKDFAEVAV